MNQILVTWRRRTQLLDACSAYVICSLHRVGNGLVDGRTLVVQLRTGICILTFEESLVFSLR